MTTVEVVWMIWLIALMSLLFTLITGIDMVKSILISIVVIGLWYLKV